MADIFKTLALFKSILYLCRQIGDLYCCRSINLKRESGAKPELFPQL